MGDRLRQILLHLAPGPGVAVRERVAFCLEPGGRVEDHDVRGRSKGGPIRTSAAQSPKGKEESVGRPD